LFVIGSHLDELDAIGKIWESDGKGVFEIGMNCSLKLLGKSVPIIHMLVGVLVLIEVVQEHVFNE
jgi:hypothetical protein